MDICGAISLSQFDYLIELRIGAGQSTYDQCETLSGILDGDEQSSDQDENQKEVKTYPLQTPVMPHLLSRSQLKDVSKSYKEASLALDVGKIFYVEKKVNAYSNLGIGRLIYQLPVNLCRIFIDEIFGDADPAEFDEEILTTVNKFFENNLNVSETSRQLFVHRNTLVYRIEKLQKSTGLDVRTFDDALTFKIAMMVVNYMKYLDHLNY